MKPIDRNEILGLADYEAIRDSFRARVIGEKKLRRVALGPSATALFENRDTVLLQIQEMLRTERITRSGAVQHEIDTYNENVPADDELSCTVMIEIQDADERDAFLQAAKGFEKHVWLVCGSERVAARAADRGPPADRTTAVHYLKFPLPKAVAEAMRATAKGQAPPTMQLTVDHKAYEATCVLPPITVKMLAEDLV
jgi:hypothetical protein